MPIEQIHGDAMERPRHLMPQVFGGSDEHGQPDEDRRRRATQASAAAQAPQSAAAQPQQPQIVASPQRQKPNAIDRLHKYHGGKYGAQIWLGHDHGPNDADQVPPQNPGFRSDSAGASSIADAMQKARSLLNDITTPGRVAINIMGGYWDEPLIVSDDRIDVFGVSRAIVNGNSVITADTVLGGLDFTAGSGYAVRLGPGSPILTPTWRANTIFDDCTMSAPETALYAFGRRFYAKNSHIYQTSRIQAQQEIAALVIENQPSVVGWTELEGCSVHSWLNTDYAMTTGLRPGGFAIAVRSDPGTYMPDNFHDGLAFYVTPSTGLLLRDSEVFGSLVNRAWLVKHQGGSQYAGIETVAAVQGRLYARLYGTPMIDPVNGYYADAPAIVEFDNCITHAQYIAEFAMYDGAHPPNVNGKGYVRYSHSEQHVPWRTANPSPWVTTASVAMADVVSSATGVQSWIRGGMAPLRVTADSQANLPALKELYMI